MPKRSKLGPSSILATTKDFRGVRLCDPCWNGLHWTKAFTDKRGVKHPTTNHCNGGTCECLCPQMPADRSGINLRLREMREAMKAAQTQFPNPGAGYSHTNPQDKVRDDPRGSDNRRRRAN